MEELADQERLKIEKKKTLMESKNASRAKKAAGRTGGGRMSRR